MNYLFSYLGEKSRGAQVYVYVLEHRVSLNYRIAWRLFTKLGRDKVFMNPPHICIDFWAKSAKGRIQGRAIIRQWGAVSSSELDCLTSQLTIFQSYMWRHLDVQAD